MPTFPSFDLSSFDMSKFELPKVDWSKFELSKVELPDFDLPEVDVDRLTALVRDVAYVGVGLAVLAVEQADKARREIDGVVRERVASRRNAA